MPHAGPVEVERILAPSDAGASRPLLEEEPEPLNSEQNIEDFLRPLVLSEQTLHNIAYEFSIVYKDLALNSQDQFLPTPVTRLPSGNEVGEFLAIDVGGTNLRVAFIELFGEPTEHVASTSPQSRSREFLRNAQRPRYRRTLEKAWPIGDHLKMDNTQDLFAWIGDCIAEVVADKLAGQSDSTIPEELDMGLTFSFPMMQDELTSAVLMPLGKGFRIDTNLQLGPALLEGYARHTRQQSSEEFPASKRRRLGSLPRLKIAAITNDTIATLASLAYSVKSLPNSRVAAGIIVGTGCNATIPMRFSDLGSKKSEKIKARNPDATETVVNTEITIAGACAPLRAITTDWDRQLDAECARPGFQPLEYMTGGRYIGELVRIIFFDYMTRKHQPPINASQLPPTLSQNYKFTAHLLSQIMARARTTADLVTDLKRKCPPPDGSNWAWELHAASALRKIAQHVQMRSAGLIAAATVGLLAAVGEIKVTDPHMVQQQQSPNRSNIPTPNSREGLLPGPGVSSWNSGPEELVIAYTGGIIQHYPNFKAQCQVYIDRLVMRAGPQEGGKSVCLREASDGGIIGAGVLAGMESVRVA